MEVSGYGGRGDLVTLGQHVRRLREQRGYSLSELSRRAGISRSYLYQIEIDASSPTHEKLEELATALEVSLQDLLGLATPPLCEPAGLREFAEEYRLSEAEIAMLAGIEYRGQRPKTARQWRLLYEVIRGTIGNEEP